MPCRYTLLVLRFTLSVLLKPLVCVSHDAVLRSQHKHHAAYEEIVSYIVHDDDLLGWLWVLARDLDGNAEGWQVDLALGEDHGIGFWVGDGESHCRGDEQGGDEGDQRELHVELGWAVGDELCFVSFFELEGLAGEEMMRWVTRFVDRTADERRALYHRDCSSYSSSLRRPNVHNCFSRTMSHC